MPATPKFQIPYPDGTSNYTPLQDWFAGIANGVEAALTTGLGGAPRLANSDSERASLFPSPVQGNSVVRPDKGYTEQYYGTYNASTNPSGATPAGWYPISGAVPTGLIRQGTGGQTTFANGASTTVATYTTAGGGWVHNMSATAGALTIGVTGAYRLYGAVVFVNAAGGIRVTRLTRNSTDDTNTIAYGPAAPGTSVSYGTAPVEVPLIRLTAGDVIRIRGFQDSGGSVNNINDSIAAGQNASAVLSATYVSPPVGG